MTTFANAKIEQEERKTIIQKICSKKSLSEPPFIRLLEKLHPDDPSNEDQYKFPNIRLEMI